MKFLQPLATIGSWALAWVVFRAIGVLIGYTLLIGFILALWCTYA